MTSDLNRELALRARLDEKARLRVLGGMFSVAIAVYVAAWVIGFVFVSRVFGFGSALMLSLVPLFPFVVGAMMRTRWPAVRCQEFVLLGVLLIVAAGAVVGLVGKWYEIGMDELHAEDVKFAAFERAISEDPAFRGIQIHPPWGKSGYWLSGTVASEREFRRLRALAGGYGITDQCLDRPLADGVRIAIAEGDHTK